MSELSILIPARREEFLQRTIDDVWAHIQGDTEILVALDNWDNPPEITIPKGQIIRTAKGQRGATNELAKLSTAKYVMKLDAHCSMGQGFDVKLMEDMEDDVTIVPAIGNLHAYDWVCPKGHRHFQGKYEKCEQCGSTNLTKDIQWKIITHPIRSSFYFDRDLHFQYMPEEWPGLVHETMSLQGSCFMCTREKYWELELCDEKLGSWGSQGSEVACKTWLSGGRVLASRKTYYGHQFRAPGEFPTGDKESHAFPYQNPSKAILAAQKLTQNLFYTDSWEHQARSLSWLIRKFDYPGNWSEDAVKELCPGTSFAV